MTSLFLYYYERKWLLKTKKWDLQKAGIFSSIFKFIGDLWTFDNNKFKNNYNNIYPDELQLKKEMKILVKSSFWNFQYKYMTEKLLLSCLIKEMPFPFISIARPIG